MSTIEEEVDKVVKVIAELARKDAIEECARVAETIPDCDARSMSKIAAAIRALKDKP